MDEDTLADFKQFIAATVSQEIASLRSDMDARFDEVDAKFTAMDKRFSSRFDDMDAKLETIADAQAETLQDHEQRLTRLESQAA